MRSSILFVLCCLSVHTLLADETKLTFTVDGVAYSNVTFGTVTPSSVTVFHSRGIVNLPLAKLPPELQKQLGYDAQKAAQYEASVQQAMQQAAAEQAKKELAQRAWQQLAAAERAKQELARQEAEKRVKQAVDEEQQKGEVERTKKLVQSNPVDLFSIFLKPEQQEHCGLYKLSQAERNSLAKICLALCSSSLGDSAVEYLKNEGWEEVKVLGTRRLKLHEWSVVEEYLIAEKGAWTYILEPRSSSSLRPGKYLGKMGSSSCEIINSNGDAVRFTTEDKR